MSRLLRVAGGLWAAAFMVLAFSPATFLRIVMFGGLAVVVFYVSWTWAAWLETNR